jgi:surface protein
MQSSFYSNKNNPRKYGLISTWNTIYIINMKLLFNDYEFNNIDDIVSNWNVSNVENMNYCVSFNQPLDNIYKSFFD